MDTACELLRELGNWGKLVRFEDKIIIVGEELHSPHHHGLSVKDGQAAVMVSWELLGMSWERFQLAFPATSPLHKDYRDYQTYKAVLARKDDKTGSTIHLYNPRYRDLIIVGKLLPQPSILNILMEFHDSIAVIIPEGLLPEVLPEFAGK